jgi:hypothetical protein
MPRKNFRVKIPTDPSERIKLAKAISAKHADLGAASPLNDMEDEADYASALTNADAQDAKADKARKEAETATGERNKHMPAVDGGIRARRDVLLGKYRSNPKKLTEFGFDVDDSPTGDDSAEEPKPPTS